MINFWPCIKPLLFRLDPERAHHMAISRLEHLQWSSWGRSLLRTLAGSVPDRPVSALGLTFRHPLGLAAGFDKDARVVLAMQELGFSYVEIGTVTPRPQPGNPKPRLWRFPEAQALVNALGFPGEGMQVVAKRLQTIRNSGLLHIPVGVNIGKNADTPLEKAVQDYAAVLDELYPFADYVAVNVSSPNTVGLRSLQTASALRTLIEPLQSRLRQKGTKPLLVKIAPDLSNEELLALAELAKELELAGMIAGNTTVRRDLVPRAASLERGGLSGAPQFSRTLEMARVLNGCLPPSISLVSCGGISNACTLQQMLSVGAKLIQIYTSLIYAGPTVIRQMI